MQEKSWQLATLIAHGLARHRRLALPDTTFETALWVTGKIDADLNVGTVGHITEKLQASETLIREAADSDVDLHFFVPANDTVPDAHPLGARIHRVHSAIEILQRLGIPVAENAEVIPEPTTPKRKTGHTTP